MATWKDRFWAAVEDRDPASMEVAQDIALEHGAKLWELGEEQAKAQGLPRPGDHSVGVFVFHYNDEGEPLDSASIQWTIYGKPSGGESRLEMWVRYAIGSSIWLREFMFADGDSLRSAQRGAAEVAWAGLRVMKSFVAEHGWNYKLEASLKAQIEETQLSDSGWGVIGAKGRRGGKFMPPIELVNPAKTKARARDENDAVAKYREFNSFDPKDLVYGATFEMPKRAQLLGDAVSVQYRSRKVIPDNGVRPRGWVYYTHDHSKGCMTYAPDPHGDVEVPSFLIKADALTLLGECVGFHWKNDEGEGEGVARAPYPELYTTANGRALFVIQNKRTVLAMSWGGRLGVEDRGIVG